MPKPEDKPEHWKTTNEMAEFFGIAKQTFNKVRSKYVAPEHKRKREGSQECEWYAPGVLQSWIDHQVEQQAKPEDEDPLMGGGSSPALERYRAARAEKEEYSVKLLRQELIHVNDFLERYGQMAAVLRGVQERMKTKWPEAHQMLDEALERMEDADGE